MLGKYNVINTTCGISEGLQPTCMAHGRYTTCEVEKNDTKKSAVDVPWPGHGWAEPDVLRCTICC
jgi:hypothetical protein